MRTVAFYDEFPVTGEITESFGLMGVEVLTFKSVDDLKKTLRSAALVMSVNFHEEIHSACTEAGMPYSVWSFDSGEYAAIHKIPWGRIRDRDFFFLFNRRDFKECSQHSKNVWLLPFSASKMFEKAPLESGFKFDILSVMNTHIGTIGSNLAFFENVLGNTPDPAQRKNLELIKSLMELVVERHKHIFDRNLMVEYLNEYVSQCGVNPFNEDNLYLLRGRYPIFERYGQMLSCLQRLQCVTELCGTGAKVDVYGDPAWVKFLEPFPNASYHSSSEYAWLSTLYNSAKVNINLNQVQNLDAVPQRVYHVLASGGFLLTNHFAELENVFKAGVHLDTFRDADELKRKALYYLVHEDERRRIASAGHDEFIKNHSMTSRLDFILGKCGV